MMKAFGSFRLSAGGEPFFGELLAGDGPAPTVQRLTGPYWVSQEPADAPAQALADLIVLAPVTPSKIIAVGLNYHDHASERGSDVPASPLTWLTAPSSLLAHEGTVELPFPEHRVDYEAELGIVIGRTAKNVSESEAEDYIFGYTSCQDISDRDIQDREKQFARAKGFDTFTPVGPFVYQGISPDNLAITLHRNGELRQNGRTSEMIFNVRTVVAFCSRGTTLLAGDLILTGTPAGVGPIKDGDLLETQIGPFAPLVVRVRNAAA